MDLGLGGPKRYEFGGDAVRENCVRAALRVTTGKAKHPGDENPNKQTNHAGEQIAAARANNKREEW
jgi:hypothetical protein